MTTPPSTDVLVVRSGADASQAVARLERGERVHAVVLEAGVEDPVRLAQRVHSLDRDGSIVIVAQPEREAELRHALEVAPFLGGDVVCVTSGEREGALAEAVDRSRGRRSNGEATPPLNAQYLGTLLDSAPIGVVTLDAGGAVVGWNRRAGEMLEVPEVQALGSSFADLWPPAERERLRELIAGLHAGGLGVGGQTFERYDRSFEVSGSRFATRPGEAGAILVLQDVTQRVAAEAELRLQKALLEAQAESAMAGIAVVSLDGRVQRMNRRFIEIWGVDEETAIHDRTRSTELIVAQVIDPEAFLAGIDRLAADVGGELRDEVVLHDGRTIERFGTHARDETGAVVGRVWFHTDITERRQEEEQLRYMAEATEILSSSLDWETTLRRVADLAVPRVADWCSVEVIDQGGRRRIAVAHTDPAKVEFARRYREQYPDQNEDQGVALTMRTGESQIYPDIPADLLVQAARDDEHLRLLRELQLKSAMVVPMQAHGRIFGAISFIGAESGRRYGPDDLRFAEELARRAAVAMDNARIHEELRRTARTLQESLLPPHLPAIEGAELAARFRPAGSVTQVGGDFYDLFETREHEWALAIGDVCGKGAEAAALTALTRYTVRAAAMYEDSAGGVLSVLNKALLRQRGDFRFTTLAYCVLTIEDGSAAMQVATGGHPRVLVMRAAGGVQPVGAAGPLLGVLPDAAYSHQDVELQTGDVIVLYTDGLTDARAPGRQLEEEDLAAELERCRGLAPAQIAERLELYAVGPDGAEPRDDIAIIVAALSG